MAEVGGVRWYIESSSGSKRGEDRRVHTRANVVVDGAARDKGHAHSQIVNLASPVPAVAGVVATVTIGRWL